MTTKSDALSHHNIDQEVYDKTLFGFWVYIMTDCILFATLFATYAALQHNTFGGPTSQDIYSLPHALIETMILLTSSFTCGLAMLEAHKGRKWLVIVFFAITFILGASFLGMELKEFHELVNEGAGWQRSAFLSAFFTLVGTHGLHITFGLFWILFMLGHVAIRGLTMPTLRRLACLSLFWHFLDVIWIFIFTIVYLMGAKA